MESIQKEIRAEIVKLTPKQERLNVVFDLLEYSEADYYAAEFSRISKEIKEITSVIKTLDKRSKVLERRWFIMAYYWL